MLSKVVITGALRSYKYSKCVLKVHNPEYIFTERQFDMRHTLIVLIVHLQGKNIIKLNQMNVHYTYTVYSFALMKNRLIHFGCFGKYCST